MADTYQRDHFLVTIEALKSSMEDNADIQQAELSAIHQAAENTSKLGEAGKGDFVKNMAMTVLAIHIQRQELQEARESKKLDQESVDENDRRDIESAEIANKSFTYWEEMVARLTPVDKIGINLWSHMVTHLGHIQEDVFQIRNIMTGVSDVREEYERMFSRELAFKQVEEIGKMVDISEHLVDAGHHRFAEPEAALYSSSARAREEEDKDEKHQGRLRKMIGAMTGHLKSMADKAKTAVKVGLVGILTALGLLWFIRFMETDTWKNLTKIMADFINTGLPILAKTLDLLVGGIIETFKTLASWWNASFGRFFNWLGEQFGITREVTVKQPVMDKDTGKQKIDEKTGKLVFKEVTKQVGFLGDGIGLLGGVILAIAAPFVVLKGAMWALAHPIKLVTGAFKLLALPFKLLTPSFWKGMIGGLSSVGSKFKNIGKGISNFGRYAMAGSATRQRLSRIQQIRAQAQSGVQQLPSQPSSGGFGRSALKNLSGLGRGIANLGKGIGRGLGKLLESTLKGLARGIGALGNARVLKGAAAMGILGLAMIPFAKAINMFSKANWKGLGIAITGMAALTTAIFALSKFAMGPSLLIGAAAMGILGLALIPLSHALGKFSKISWSSIGKGIVAILGFSLAVGALGAAMMTGFGALALGAGVVAVLALSAALYAFGKSAESSATGLGLIEPKLKSMAKLPIGRLLKLGVALAGLGAGLLAFSVTQLGSRFFNWVGKLFGGSGPMDDIMELAKSAPNLTQLNDTLKTFGKTLKNFGGLTSMSSTGVKRIKEFIKAFDLDEDSDLRALAAAFTGFARIPFDKLKGQLESLSTGMQSFGASIKKLADNDVKNFKKFMEAFDHDEGSDMLALAKMWESFAKIKFETLWPIFSSGVSFKKIFEMPKLTLRESAAWRALFDRMRLLLDKMIEAKKAGVGVDLLLQKAFPKTQIPKTSSMGKTPVGPDSTPVKTTTPNKLITDPVPGPADRPTGRLKIPYDLGYKRGSLGQLKSDEGFRSTVYKDTELIDTIGYGFNLERGDAQKVLDAAGINKSVADLRSGRAKLTEPEASKLMQSEIPHFQGVAQRYVDKGKQGTWAKLSPDRQMVLTNMAYNMGAGGLNEFVKTRKLIQAGDFKEASLEMMRSSGGGTSLWAQQVGDRATRLSARMAGSQIPNFQLASLPTLPYVKTGDDIAKVLSNIAEKTPRFQGSGKQTDPTATPSLNATRVNAGTTELQIARDTTARGREQTQDENLGGVFNSTQVDNSTRNQFVGSRSSAPEDHRMASLQKLAWT